MLGGQPHLRDRIVLLDLSCGCHGPDPLASRLCARNLFYADASCSVLRGWLPKNIIFIVRHEPPKWHMLSASERY
jgi:hypothetical protein